ncbi:C-Maf-inducing protein-like [Limulus polyphemus]|uniref:C-Maf-inducing protein-like n=1 Tax=Limulus polyphemus TaxID=6850 RepID=A0ABM1SV34_LIMPO|nr:C-Maf-inducing protein-like [Limulus polyphemus]
MCSIKKFRPLPSERYTIIAQQRPSVFNPDLNSVTVRNLLHSKRSRLLELRDTRSECPCGSCSSCLSGHQYSTMCHVPFGGLPFQATPGIKLKLLHEADVRVCKVVHSRNVVRKLLGTKFLPKWENHHLFFTDTEILSRSSTGFMEEPIPYSQIEEIHCLPIRASSQKICIRIVIPSGSVVLRVSNTYVRDQWLHSLFWKRTMLRHQKLLSQTERCDVLLKELKSLVDLALSTPLQGESIFETPLNIISSLMKKDQKQLPLSSRETVISIVAPLLERASPSDEICEFLCWHCKESPGSYVIVKVLPSIVQRILKHSVDFGKHPKRRLLVQAYIEALYFQSDGVEGVQDFVRSVHGPSSLCPHPRLMPNLVSTSLAAVYSLFEEKKRSQEENLNNELYDTLSWESQYQCFLTVFQTIALFEDWRPGLAELLQPIPFHPDALECRKFTKNFQPVIEEICKDSRCEVHITLLGIRDGKDGWFQIYCPESIACDDGGDLWSLILKRLLGCCCRRKRFIHILNKHLESCMLRALREDETCQKALSTIVEMDMVENPDTKLEIIATLQSTPSGRKQYAALCQREKHLREFQRKEGPRKLVLPPKSTDSDLHQLLSSGPFGNLEWLSLAFTKVTSVSAEHLIKLPSLRYLNLWSTQFDDSGVMLISEHLYKLEVLNLCETKVTDKGLITLANLKNLQKLNLNSTSLSSQTFQHLKTKLPALEECDIRYTDAW